VIIKMPYITRDLREKLDPQIETIIWVIKHLNVSDYAGVLNYVITRIIGHFTFKSYSSINRAIGVLECAKLELYRRLAAPHEDQKMKENGDCY